MIRRGDRIVTVNADADDVSGIVVMAEHVGCSDFGVVVYEGGVDVDGKPMVCVSPQLVSVLDIEVTERSCAVPEIPASVGEAFRKSVEIMRTSFAAEHPDFRKATDRIKASFTFTDDEIANMREGTRDLSREDLRDAIREIMLSIVAEDQRGDRDFRRLFIGAAFEIADDMVDEWRPSA